MRLSILLTPIVGLASVLALHSTTNNSPVDSPSINKRLNRCGWAVFADGTGEVFPTYDKCWKAAHEAGATGFEVLEGCECKFYS